jgi:hypothetical protein
MINSKSHTFYILSPLRLIMANQKPKPSELLTEEEQYFVCRAINLYGSEHHPWATPEMLDSFYDDYIMKVMRIVVQSDLTEEGRITLHQIKEKLTQE